MILTSKQITALLREAVDEKRLTPEQAKITEAFIRNKATNEAIKVVLKEGGGHTLCWFNNYPDGKSPEPFVVWRKRENDYVDGSYFADIDDALKFFNATYSSLPDITDEQLENVMEEAWVGIGHWGCPIGNVYNSTLWELLVAGKEIIIKDVESPSIWRLDLVKLRNGVSLMRANYRKHYVNLVSESNFDVKTGDVLIQLALFGDIEFS